jgi:hypothetical protein
MAYFRMAVSHNPQVGTNACMHTGHIQGFVRIPPPVEAALRNETIGLEVAIRSVVQLQRQSFSSTEE